MSVQVYGPEDLKAGSDRSGFSGLYIVSAGGWTLHDLSGQPIPALDHP